MAWLVAAEIPVMLLLLGAHHGRPATLTAGLTGLVVLAVAFGRVGPHRGYERLGLAVAYALRPTSLTLGARPLEVLRPGARIERAELDGRVLGVLADGSGRAAVLELGDALSPVGTGYPAVTVPLGLLAPPPGEPTPGRLQLVVSTVSGPAPGTAGSVPAAAYRQLTEGRVPAVQRAFLGVHVDPPASPEMLGRAVRRTLARLERAGVPCRPLGPVEVEGVLAELAHVDPGGSLDEHWSWLRCGGVHQSVLALRDRRPDMAGAARGTAERAPGAAGPFDRLLVLPYCAVTLAVTVEQLPVPRPTAAPAHGQRGAVRVDAVVRLAAPDAPALAAGQIALGEALEHTGMTAVRLDGRQLAGLAASLPPGAVLDPAEAVLARLLAGGRDRAPAPAVAGELSFGGAGLVLGVDRHGRPVTVRPMRPVPTRMVLFGGVPRTQLLVLRALAVGSRVAVHTGRPHRWERFVRGVDGGADAVRLVRPDRPGDRRLDAAPAGPLRPYLVVLDLDDHEPDDRTPASRAHPGTSHTGATHAATAHVGTTHAGVSHAGATGAGTRQCGEADAGARRARVTASRPSSAGAAVPAGAPWTATLVVRDRLTAAGVDDLTRADLVLLPRLSAPEAALAADALGLGAGADWLTRIPADMVGVLTGAGPLRWALLSPTDAEDALIGPLG